MRVFHPDVFQGNLRLRRYFEGWYFKHVAADGSNVLAIIPGVALSADDPHAFIQILDGIRGRSWYVRYSLEDVDFSTTKLELRIGRSVFTYDGVMLDITSPEVTLVGQVRYSNMIRYPSRWSSPGIMGWYSFVPRMECKHAILSIRHRLEGRVVLNGQQMNFTDGVGYIEKDWGTSFPSGWVWIQGNMFSASDASFMCSIARIPWLGKEFIGFLCYLWVGHRFYLFTTYNGSHYHRVSVQDATVQLEVRNARWIVRCTIEQKTRANLRAPQHGAMRRYIKESTDSDIDLQLLNHRGEALFADRGTHAGIEIAGDIVSRLAE